jgi:hypothetical protein
MALKKSFRLLLVVLALGAPLAAQAQTTEEVIDGGTCIPYPPYNPATNTYSSINWQHWLYGFSGTAFCHLTMPGDWPVNTLSYVLFTGGSPGVVTARLCVHAYDLAVACGGVATISGDQYQVNFVLPPPLPPNADGAFVQFNFPSNTVSTINELIPVWSK